MGIEVIFAPAIRAVHMAFEAAKRRLKPGGIVAMRQTLRSLTTMGKTVFVSSHILPELGSVCDLVGIIEKGQLLTQGTVREITGSLRQNE